MLQKKDGRVNNGGKPGVAGRKSREELGLEAVRNTTVQVEDSVILKCREKYGSLAGALRFAAEQAPKNPLYPLLFVLLFTAAE